MEVDIVLPAVPRLVLVGEPGVEGDRLLQVGALHPDSRLRDSEIWLTFSGDFIFTCLNRLNPVVPSRHLLESVGVGHLVDSLHPHH